ncbi:MAG: phosphopantothenoylcysteine decarboxylase [Acidimicrobiales bacterium]
MRPRTTDVAANAAEKLARKGADLLVANDVSAPSVGFEHDTNGLDPRSRWLGPRGRARQQGGGRGSHPRCGRGLPSIVHCPLNSPTPDQPRRADARSTL